MHTSAPSACTLRGSDTPCPPTPLRAPAVLTCGRGERAPALSQQGAVLGGSREGEQTRVCVCSRKLRERPSLRPPCSVTRTPCPSGARMPLTCSCVGRAWGQVHLGLASLSWAPEGASAVPRPQLALATLSGSLTQQWSLEVRTSIHPPLHTQQSLKPPGPQRLFAALANLDLPVCAMGTCLASSADSISLRESQTLCVCPVCSVQRAALVWEDRGLWNSACWDGGSGQVGLGWPSAVLLCSLAVFCSGRDGPR